jgi:hypothetical protein
MYSVGVGGQERGKSLFMPGAHLSAVSGLHDGFIVTNECTDLEFCNWRRIHLQGEGNG